MPTCVARLYTTLLLPRASAPRFFRPVRFSLRGFHTSRAPRSALGNMADLAREDKNVCKGEVRGETSQDIQKEESKKEVAEEKPLPKLSAADFAAYNSMAEKMDYFHNMFRQTWTTIHTSVQNNRRPQSMSLKQFLALCTQFTQHLAGHHSIEENYVFPMLAKKMPQFKNSALLLEQHKKIHEGMDGFEQYVEEVKRGDRELVLRELGERMGWGEVLWTHLDEEVRTLGAENMRKYWTVAEMRRMPM